MTIIIRDCRLLNLNDPSYTTNHMNLIIEGSRIVSVPPNSPVEISETGRVIDGKHHLVVPGLINFDLHPEDLVFRSRFENLPVEITQFILSAPDGLLGATPEQLYDLALFAGILSLRYGTTSITYHLTITADQVVKKLLAVRHAFELLGLRATIAIDIRIEQVPICKGQLLRINNLDPVQCRKLQQSLMDALQEWGKLEETKIRIAIAPSVEFLLNPTLRSWLAEITEKHCLPIHLHAHATRSQTIDVLQHNSGQSLIQIAYQAGLLNQRTHIIDAVWLDDEDIALIAGSGSLIVHNPLSDLYPGSGVFSMNKFLDAKIPVVLGSGRAAGGNINLFDAVKVAASIQRVVQPDYRRWPTVYDIFRMAVGHLAGYGQLEGPGGKINEGEAADIILLDTRTYSFTPFNDVVDQLVCLETGDAVDTVIVGGETIWENKHSTKIDFNRAALLPDRLSREMEPIYENTRRWQATHEADLYKTYFETANMPLGFNRRADGPVAESLISEAVYNKNRQVI